MAVWSIIKKSELEGALRTDAEYYRPEYIETEKLLDKRGAVRLGQLLNDIRYGIYTEPIYMKEGIDFIRALNLQEYSIEREVLKIRPEAIASDKYRLREGDVLIVRSGANVGNVGIIQTPFIGATFGSYTIRLRFNKKINPYLAYIFFKTCFGRFQTLRFRTGLAQPNINIPNLKLLKIVTDIPQYQQEIVEGKVKRAHEDIVKSQLLYLQAERILLDDLDLDYLDFSQPNYYTTSLKNAQKVSRVDAEHFQPKYDKLIQHLKKTGETRLLGEITHYIKRGLQPVYAENGEIIVVNSQHLGRYLLNIEATERTDYTFWQDNKRARLQKKDVLLYSTGAYVGRTNSWFEEQKGIASNHVTIIRPKKECNPIYLAVYLNAFSGLRQAERWATGSGQREIYPEAITNFWVYLPSVEFQAKIAKFVIESYEVRKKAKALLEEAKQKVEEMIG